MAAPRSALEELVSSVDGDRRLELIRDRKVDSLIEEVVFSVGRISVVHFSGGAGDNLTLRAQSIFLPL